MSERVQMKNRFLAGITLALGIVGWTAVPAFAHVTVDPTTAPKGGQVALGFRVANERPDASTTQVQIFFPTDHPILQVAPQSIRGWQDKVTTRHLASPVATPDGPVSDVVSEVDWSGGPIAPGHFQEFQILATGLPTDTDQLVFKALQTYSNGDVVRWIDPVTAGQPDPDHPTPVLKLSAIGSGVPASPAAATNPTATAQTSLDTSRLAKKSSVSTATTIGIVGMVLGALGLVAALWALRMLRRTRA
jgi:uncharacterized protein YcnI